MRPDSITALPRSMRFTVPVTSFSPRPRKSCRICSRSASRIFCRITCFAAWAPMRPNSIGSSGSSINSSSCMSACCLSASDSGICCGGFSTASSATTCQRRKDSKSPVSRSTATRTSASSLKRFLVAEASAISSATKTTSLLTFFSRARASTSNKISRLIYSTSDFKIRSWAPVAPCRYWRARCSPYRPQFPAAACPLPPHASRR